MLVTDWHVTNMQKMSPANVTKVLEWSPTLSHQHHCHQRHPVCINSKTQLDQSNLRFANKKPIREMTKTELIIIESIQIHFEFFIQAIFD